MKTINVGPCLLDSVEYFRISYPTRAIALHMDWRLRPPILLGATSGTDRRQRLNGLLGIRRPRSQVVGRPPETQGGQGPGQAGGLLKYEEAEFLR